MVEDDPEYQLIVKANTITVAIDNEVLVVHKVTTCSVLMFLVCTLDNVAIFIKRADILICSSFLPSHPTNAALSLTLLPVIVAEKKNIVY